MAYLNTYRFFFEKQSFEGRILKNGINGFLIFLIKNIILQLAIFLLLKTTFAYSNFIDKPLEFVAMASHIILNVVMLTIIAIAILFSNFLLLHLASWVLGILNQKKSSIYLLNRYFIASLYGGVIIINVIYLTILLLFVIKNS